MKQLMTALAAAAVAVTMTATAQAQSALNEILDGGCPEGRHDGRLEPDDRARPGHQQLQGL